MSGARVNWPNGVKLFLAIAALVFFLIFFVLAVIRADSDIRGKDKPAGWVFTWSTILMPLAISGGLVVLWLIVNFFTHMPLTGEHAGTGGQLYYNLINQLLVKRVNTRAIENLNQ